MNLQASIGVFIEDSRISMVYLVRNLRNIKLTTYETRTLEKGLSWEERLKKAGDQLELFIKRNDITSADIFLSIPRSKVIARFIELPATVKHDLRFAIRYEIEKYIPFPPDDIYYDCQVVLENKEDKTLTALLVASSKKIMSPIFDIIDRHDLEVSGIEISSLSIFTYCLLNENIPDKDHWANVWANDEYIEFNLFKSGRLCYSKHLPVPEKEKTLYQVVADELKALRSASKKDELDIIFCGPLVDPDRLADIKEVKESLHLHRTSSTKDMTPSMMAAYGAALRIYNKAPMDINLLPDTMRKKPNKTGMYTMLVLSCMLVISVVVWAGSIVVHKNLYLKRLDTTIARLAPEVHRIERMQTRYNALKARFESLNSFRKKKNIVLDILKELSLHIPDTAWINRFIFSDHRVEIHGRAQSASNLIPRLEASPMFSDVSFISSITKRRDGKEDFRIGLSVKEAVERK